MSTNSVTTPMAALLPALIVRTTHLLTISSQFDCLIKTDIDRTSKNMKSCKNTYSTAADEEKPVNPFGKQHGAPGDSERHVGDLGNLKTDGQGNAKGSHTDDHIKLIGEQSVLGVCPTTWVTLVADAYVVIKLMFFLFVS